MNEVIILSLEGCKDTLPTIELLEKTAGELNLDINLSHIKITSSEEAIRLKFPGSPTVRVNGLDIEQEMRNTTSFGLS
ncbi:DUF2703 domain-containing protein [bacterium]|nr:DUF2703 domain-containing protein [bacterium]